MASRRTRIKGIANIPQRKKNVQENVSNVDSNISDNSLNTSEYDLKDIKLETRSDELILKTEVDTSVPIEEDSSEIQNNLEVITNPKVDDTDVGISVVRPSSFLSASNSIVTEDPTDFSKDNDIEIPVSCLVTPDTTNQNSETIKTEIPKPKNNIIRRKFLKPGINLNAVKKRQTNTIANESLLKVESSTFSQDEIKQQYSDESEAEGISINPIQKVKVISDVIIPEWKNISSACDTNLFSKESINDHLDQKLYSETTLNETHLGINASPATNSSVVVSSPIIKKVVPETHIVSDSEYPAPPPSPSKINRARIKAIPRLSQRKTSCSASESEDESRKYGRIRNNSVCSVISTSGLEPPTPISETIPPKDIILIAPKKITRTEQSRKLAEARREFQKRFGANSPDKQRLKMIDLIFYNPTTNPMSQKATKTPSEIDDSKPENEEEVDNPLEKEDVKPKEKANDTENSMPVPQIKIGPSGEIILDEQSLIVENAEVARQKEKIRNSRILDGDFETGYGIYKRAARSPAWNQKETLRFYKALNLIGTDFTVMTQLFPKRTRRELKMKFKKEEKVNKLLIDKAIMQPCNYNFSDLKRELELEEAEEAALKRIKEEEIKHKMKQKIDSQKMIKEKREKKALEHEADRDTLGILYEANEEKPILPPKKRLKTEEKPFKTKNKLRKIKVKPINIKSVLDDSDADISDMETQSESEEEETIPFLKPTRSGRIPKSTKRFVTFEQLSKQNIARIQANALEEVPYMQSTVSDSIFITPEYKQSNNAIRNRRSSSIESNSEKLVPGSVVIMTEEDAHGKSEYKVFMVTPDKKLAPLELESDVIAKLIKERQSQEDSDEFVVPSVPEKNVTIPASDTVNFELEKEDPLPEKNFTIPALDTVNFELQKQEPLPERNVTIPASDTVNLELEEQEPLSENNVTIVPASETVNFELGKQEPLEII